MKTFSEICDSLKKFFYDSTKIDIERGSVMDMFMSASANEIAEAHKVIEENKKPYLFSNQSGAELDSTGYFVSCPRYQNEKDNNYFYRLVRWNQNNATCNSTSIENRFGSLNYSTAANYIPHTKGVGTGTIYLVPHSYSKRDKELALNEAQEKLSEVINPSSIVEFKIPEPRYVKLVAYIDTVDNTNALTTKNEITDNLKKYINSIAPGEKLYLGEINKIGLSPKEVQYFNVVQIYINDEEATDFEILQTSESKFIFDEFIWWNVEN